MRVSVKKKNIILARDVHYAKKIKDRMIGLMFSDDIEKGDGLWIQPCNSIHTFFMKYAIDVIFIDKELQILKIYKALKPWRITPLVWGAASVLELRANSIDDRAAVGDYLEVSYV